MTVTAMQCEVDAEGQQEDSVTTVPESLERARCQREFLSLSRRHAQLARSFKSEDQRERTRLQAQLMKLWTVLNPKSIYKWDDDFDVVMRAQRRQ